MVGKEKIVYLCLNGTIDKTLCWGNFQVGSQKPPVIWAVFWGMFHLTILFP